MPPASLPEDLQDRPPPDSPGSPTDRPSSSTARPRAAACPRLAGLRAGNGPVRPSGCAGRLGQLGLGLGLVCHATQTRRLVRQSSGGCGPAGLDRLILLSASLRVPHPPGVCISDVPAQACIPGAWSHRACELTAEQISATRWESCSAAWGATAPASPERLRRSVHAY